MGNIYEDVEQEFHHEHTPVPTKQQKSNGVMVVVLQCATCGERLREASKSLYNLEALPWFDETLRQGTQEQKNARRQELREERSGLFQQEREDRLSEWLTQQEEQNKAWWEKYNSYLKTPHWANLRRIVILRDNCKCQNCFRSVTEQTAHVHHTSYVGFNRLGYSYAFECVTLCRDCHINFHAEPTGAELTRRW